MNDILNLELIRLGDYTLKLNQIILVFATLVVSYILFTIIKSVLNRNKKLDMGQKYTAIIILKYFLVVAVVLNVFQILGINLSVLMASSAALFIGIGLGIQNLFNDFISGIIILMDGSVKVGHVVQLKEDRLEVVAIKFRTSVVKNREGKEVIIPNSMLTKNEIVNWSSQKNINRHFIEVQVKEADVEITLQLLTEIVQQHKRVLSAPAPYARIQDFGSYSIKLRILFWSDEVFAVGRMMGEIRLSILRKMKEKKIVMPIPQQTVIFTPTN